MSFKDTAKAKRLILLLLQDMESATTEELITEDKYSLVLPCKRDKWSKLKITGTFLLKRISI